jgi:hypothetical protein
MAATVIDSVSVQLEQVSDILARYYDQSTSLSSRLKPSKTVAASRYLYRIPFMRSVGGTLRKYIANGGDMGAGTGPVYSNLEAGYFDSTYNFEITKEQKDYAESNGSAMDNVMTEILTNAFTQLEVYDNIFLFGDGTGKYTNAASASPAANQLTFASSTDTIGVNRLFLGMAVSVWDATGATKRAGGPYYISNIDWTNKIVTFTANITGVASTDLLAVDNVDVYGPATLTSFSSTWPGGGLTDGNGLTGDSWRHGLAYVNNATGANYYLGKLRSSYGDLVPVQVAAASNALTFSMVELAKNLAIQKRDEKIMEGMQCVVHMAQRAQLQDTLVAVSSFYRDSTSANMIDLQPRAENEFEVSGVKFFVDKRQDKARVDAFNAKNWFRVEGHPSQWLDYGDGQKIRLMTVGSTGNAKAAYEMKVVQKMDTGCSDPGAGFYIDGLAVPTNY